MFIFAKILSFILLMTMVELLLSLTCCDVMTERSQHKGEKKVNFSRECSGEAQWLVRLQNKRIGEEGNLANAVRLRQHRTIDQSAWWIHFTD